MTMKCYIYPFYDKASGEDLEQVQIRLCATQCAQEVSGPGVSDLVDTRGP